MQKVIVGLSGGVDSFVTALLLQQQGYEVVGVYLQLWEDRGSDSPEAVGQLCRHLNIPLHFFDGNEIFHEQVVIPFIQAYLNGSTPNPCSSCNSFVKWNLLRTMADRLNVPFLATGHYVRKEIINGHHYFLKGVDPQKDQSYFLWGVNESIIRRSITPLGKYTKNEVKAIARQHGFNSLADQQESMSICFLAGKDYRDFILQHSGEHPMFRSGEIITGSGEIIGNHSGLLHYTIGQKRGIPLYDGQPLYVSEIDNTRNILIVKPKEQLYARTLHIRSPHFISGDDLSATDIDIKIRGIGLNPEGFISLHQESKESIIVSLSHPAWAPAPGQPVAFYRGDRLIGGGILHLSS